MSQEKKLPPFLYSMLPHSWQRVEARKYSASAQCMMLHLAGFLFGWHKTEAKISYSVLEKFSGLSRPTVIRACRELVEGRLITHRVENGISIFGVFIEEDLELKKVQDHVEKEIKNGKDALSTKTFEQNETQEIFTSQNSLLAKPLTSQNSLPPASQNFLPIKETLHIKKSISKEREPLAGIFLEKIYFNYETRKFENVDGLQKFVTREYFERIRHFGLDGQKIYDDACESIFQRKGTPLEVKKPGFWLLSIFKDASYGNVFKCGATNAAEKDNFVTNYALWCSVTNYKDFQVSGRFLCVKDKEFNFYSSPEIFRKVLEGYAS